MTFSPAPARFGPLTGFTIGLLLLMNIYAPQALLPLLAREFGLSTAQVGAAIGSTTLAIALASPVAGLLADALGRRRVMLWAFALLLLPCLGAAFAGNFTALNVARFAQGLLIPLVSVALTAYLAEETPPGTLGRYVSAYISGTVLGGFLGRFVSGLVAHGDNWHAAFWFLMVTNALGLALVWRLPPSRRFQPALDRHAAARTLRSHLKNTRLLTLCVVGFLILFVLVAVFNTIPFRLSAPPYHLGSGALGGIFAVYLLGVVVTPASAPFVARLGTPRALVAAAGLSLLGLALTLFSPLWVVIAGLALASSGVFIAQAAAQSAIQFSVSEGRSLAGGLYNATYYAGAAVASVAAGAAYDAGGWRAVAALCALALLGVAGPSAVVGRRLRQQEAVQVG
ncbi:MFS transporter [Deinococcus sp. VB142]|uniref:MFS transporter n=1 Tax=Deinococcus sp. VB142 TaxID=3112952 RepID=A0AAU6Q5J0_9DEIO